MSTTASTPLWHVHRLHTRAGYLKIKWQGVFADGVGNSVLNFTILIELQIGAPLIPQMYGPQGVSDAGR
ncbi:hypothetical protein AFLA_007949 [Aspergillus flavus NRRL3357]|nr:hypothetical protein AFLA_007949 [Aspergillus flavus NRRL3357]